jgi:DNA-directed RNA polymerase subunit RPC12/RpoP
MPTVLMPMPTDERDTRLQPVCCTYCGAKVLVAKFSPQHTSVQWDKAAMKACLEFSALVSAGGQSALIEGCGAMRDSIDAAVSAGHLTVVPP